jgi:hypothetical protein
MGYAQCSVCFYLVRLKNAADESARPTALNVKTRREVCSRRAASFQFDPVLVTSWSPSRRGFSIISLLDGRGPDGIEPREMPSGRHQEATACWCSKLRRPALIMRSVTGM